MRMAASEMTDSAAKCFQLSRGAQASQMRLFCFPCAGGGPSAFSSWQKRLSLPIEVNAVSYPGREARYCEPTYAGMDEAVDELVPALAQRLDQPFAFFGHSMGALLAFETAHELGRRYRVWPRQLFVCACRGPSVPFAGPRLSHLPDRALIDHLQENEGIPAAIAQDKELMDLCLPAIRSDIQISERYQHVPRSTLPVPITVYGGTDDAYVAEQELAAWSEESSVEFRQEMFAGGHYLNQNADLLRSLEAGLKRDI